MLGTIDLPVFVAAGLLLNITPGADMLFIANRSAAQGTRAGVVAALGIGAGCFSHILFAVCGLSLILVTSSLAFTVVKTIGALYLIYLGITTLLSLCKKPQAIDQATGDLPLKRIFWQATLVNTLNPKVALFFMALLPQFVSPVSVQPSMAFLFLGCVFTFNGTLVNLLVALFAATVASKLRGPSSLGRLLKAAVGGLFVALGIKLAVSGAQT